MYCTKQVETKQKLAPILNAKVTKSLYSKTSGKHTHIYALF